MKILHTADIHLGAKDYGKVDPKTGKNTRLLDFQRCFEFMVRRGIEEDIDVFLFCGDAFHTHNPTPTQQDIFARCLKPLVERSIPIVMITGNHDHPVASSKVSSIEIFSHLEGAARVFRRPESTTIQTKSGLLQLIALPWPIRSLLQLPGDVHKRSPEELVHAVHQYYVDFIQRKTKEMSPDVPTVLAGHFTVSGSRTGGSERSLLQLKEPIWTTGELSVPPIDYVALGHIHQFQNLAADDAAVPVVYCSSIDRVTFNEEKSEKGFVLVDIKGNPKKTTFHFVPTPARKFVTIKVDARQASDPTEAILQRIKRTDISGAVVRVRYELGTLRNAEVDLNRIRAALEPAMAIALIEREAEPVERQRRTTVTKKDKLQVALERYIDQRDDLKGDKVALVAKALALEKELIKEGRLPPQRAEDPKE